MVKDTENNKEESKASGEGFFSETMVYKKIPWSGYKLLKDLEEGLIEIFEHIIGEYEFLTSLAPEERKDGMADIWQAYSTFIQPV